jgi:uncharacterized membrane protein YfcA
MSPGQVAAMAAVILFAYVIRGLTGFGSALVAVPLLVRFLPLQFVVPFMMALDFTASFMLGGSQRKHIVWGELKWLLPASMAGALLGIYLLLRLPQDWLLPALGALVMLFGLRNVLALHGEAPIARAWAIPAGLIGGSVSALFGTGGPPYVIYLSHRLRDKTLLRATFSGLFVIDGGFRLLVFLASGLLLQPHLWLAWLLALPVAALGLFLGHTLHLGLSNAQMLRLVGVLLVFSGGALVWKAL